MTPRPCIFFAADKEGVQASAQSGSLLAQDTAPDFFSTLDVETQGSILARERAGEYTGDRLFLQRPEVYREVVRCLGDGMGVHQIAKRLRPLSVNSVRAVAKREAAAVDTRREKTVSALTDFVMESAERLRDEGGSIPVSQLAVPLGIAIEKMQLLSGGATQRVEVVEVNPIDDWNGYVASLPSANPSTMGLGGGTPGQKGGPGSGPPGAIDVPAEVVPTIQPAGSDVQSRGFDGPTEANLQDATPLATPGPSGETLVETASQHPEGGRGSRNGPPPATLAIHSAAREIGPKGVESLPGDFPGMARQNGAVSGTAGQKDPWERLKTMSESEQAAYAQGTGPSCSQHLATPGELGELGEKNGGAVVGPVQGKTDAREHTAPLSPAPSGAGNAPPSAQDAHQGTGSADAGTLTHPEAKKRAGVRVCGFCGGKAQGIHFTDSLGNGEGDEVDLCNECGGENGPAMSVIWDAFRERGPYTELQRPTTTEDTQ